MKCPHCGGALPAPSSRIENGALAVDLLRREASVNGVEVRIVGKLWDLLALFMRNPDRVLTRGAIANLWRYEPSQNLIHKHVSRLRAIIGSEFIETVPSAGYRLRPTGS